MRRIALASAALCLFAWTNVRADDTPSPADASAIQGIINQQIEAFRTENGAAAEAFASPGIQKKFPSPDGFMGMVKGAYAPLIRPRSTHFDSLAQTGLGVVQKMTLVDSAGAVWTVAYTMTQVDGQWRISGCFILKSDAVNA